MNDVAPLINRDRLRAYVDREARVWGHLVKSRRQRFGLTLEQVAGLADTTPQTVFKVERGQITPRDDLRISLAMALSCEVGDLFPMPDRATVLREAEVAAS